MIQKSLRKVREIAVYCGSREIYMPIHRASWIVVLLSAVLFTACKMSPDYPQIVVDTFTANNTNESNTYLTLIDSEGNVIAEDDDGNPDQVNHNGCSRINYQGGLPAGIYYIKVQHPSEATVTSPYYGIRVLDYDPGSSFPGFSGADSCRAWSG